MNDIVDIEMEKKIKDPELKELYSSLAKCAAPSEMKDVLDKFVEDASERYRRQFECRQL